MRLKMVFDIIFVDTAGRLQTKTNLMQELGKIKTSSWQKHPGAPHRSILVLDATTGQNALSQAKLFKEAANADELILTKLDGTAKGGVAIALWPFMQENLPISYIGLGENGRFAAIQWRKIMQARFWGQIKQKLHYATLQIDR